ncbi:MAG: YicC/YloC family endoribonuclease [Gemmatimonadota bacterium]
MPVVASMTGFGTAESPVGTRRARVEIRTVNHRFFNLAARLPSELSAHEAAVRELLRSRFDRGHVSVSVQWVDETAAPMAAINVERAEAVKAALSELADRLGMSGTVSLEHVLRFPDVVSARREEGSGPVEWSEVAPAFEAAADLCQAARKTEGTVLAGEIEGRLAAIETGAAGVAALLPARLGRELGRLRQSVTELLGGAAAPEERLAQEIALMADRADVTEELVRLRAHVEAARAALRDGGPVGKRLGFLAQELGREVNTIGSKANDAAIAHLVVAMKGELEKVREQLENLE